jgi:hypothetical protein
LQVLFFTPATRDALLCHVPDPALEFSLTDEMSFLFRMLATAAQGTVCQACCGRKCSPQRHGPWQRVVERQLLQT